MDIASAFGRRVSVGVAGSSGEFVATGMLHVKTKRIAQLGTGLSRMQRSRTMGYRVQLTPVRSRVHIEGAGAEC